jgi:hypothetical protein
MLESQESFASFRETAYAELKDVPVMGSGTICGRRRQPADPGR